MNWSNLGAVLAAGAAVLAAMQLATWLWSRAAGKLAVVDVVWGLGFVLVGWAAALVGDGDGLRRGVLAVLVTLWGLRLTWHLWRRSRGAGEDPRYEKRYGDKGPLETALRVFGIQGVLQWLISLPIQVSAAVTATGGGKGALGLGTLATVVFLAGVALWGVGLAFEAVGDAQLERFKADPANRGQLLTTGLWAWTRHPNYAGDAAVWWGMWLVAASSLHPLMLALAASPALMTYFLRNVSGAKLLEQSMRTKPGWDEYAERTAYFFPRPPRG